MPIEVSIRSNSKRDKVLISQDEGCWKLNEDKLRSLRPAFSTDGTVTAGNASQLSDGAAALIVVSEDKLHELQLRPLAAIVSYADAEQEAADFTTSPAVAVPRALQRAGLSEAELNQQDFFEINEAFACVALLNRSKLKINEYNLNMYGGIALLMYFCILHCLQVRRRGGAGAPHRLLGRAHPRDAHHRAQGERGTIRNCRCLQRRRRRHGHGD